MDELNCAICKERVDGRDKNSYSCLTEKGVSSIRGASKQREDVLEISVGDNVHTSCRSKYTNKRVIEQDKKRYNSDAADTTKKARLRSTDTFDFISKCLFCTNTVTQRELRDQKAFKVLSRYREFDKHIIDTCEKRNDLWASSVKGRIAYTNDLHAADAVYHTSCDSSFRSGKSLPMKYRNVSSVEPPVKCGKPVNVDRATAFNHVLGYLKENDEEQLTINDLVMLMEEQLQNTSQEAFSAVWMKERLMEELKDEIVISEVKGLSDVITLRKNTSRILHDFYALKKSDDIETEKQRIVLAAAELLKTEIKEITEQSINYPSTDEIEHGIEYIPSLLSILLNKLFVAKGSVVKRAAIGQAIMQAVRPRAITAPLQIGLGVQMHKLYGSRFLIDSLHSMGFCAAYSEVQKFEQSAAFHQGINLEGMKFGSFLQHVADNVDHNLRTIDGFNTFHGMGIVAIVTPKIAARRLIPKVTLSTSQIIEVGKIEIHTFRHTGKKNVLKYESLPDFVATNALQAINIFWKCTWLLKPERPLWNGFMQMINKGEHPGVSSVIFMPMIDMKSTDESCLLSTMYFVLNQAKQYNVDAVLTMDQPLYWKASEIVNSESGSSQLRKIILRLGGLHTCMSFLGSIGYLMESTGLQTIMETVYAEHTVPHMLNGKAISRATRGHLLIFGVLHGMIVSNIYECTISNEDQSTDSEKQELLCFSDDSKLSDLSQLFDRLLAGEIDATNVSSDPLITELSDAILAYRHKFSISRTAILWFQYLDMIEILLKFIQAERMGNFHLHLQSVKEMLPYFAAAGHHHYTKSAYMYLQSMSNLETTNPDVYQKFLAGYHVVRRSDRLWSGLSTDLVIEQVLMRSLKTSGGMTRGRGMTEQQRTVWLLSTPACAEVNDAMQHFSGVFYETSEQHKEVTPARLKKDFTDASKIMEYVAARSPFSEDINLINIHTGEVADKSVNADDAFNVGMKILNSMCGISVYDYSFKKKDRAVTMKVHSTVELDGEVVVVDPQLLFQRLITTLICGNTDTNLETAFSYELSTFPTSIIDNDGLLREANKPQLADAIWKDIGGSMHKPQIPDDVRYVLDGGALLFKISWRKGMSYNDICMLYIDYVIRHYGEGTIVVFDGYSSGPSTKDITHIRRSKGKVGRVVQFQEQSILNMAKDEFLVNLDNRQRFLEMLTSKMNSRSLNATQSTGDADVLIAMSATEAAKLKPTVVVGKDTDVLVLLIHQVDPCHHPVFYTSDEKSKTAPKIWDIKHTKELLGNEICDAILPIHALLGCDTTSRMFSIGKQVALQKFRKMEKFRNAISIFNDPNAKQGDIVEAGEELLLMVYGGKDTTLDKLRLQKFQQKLAVSSTAVAPESLNPTSSAASFHSLRVYYQVQCWKNHGNIEPTDWGWEVRKGKMYPIYTNKKAAPESLLKVIRCGCKGDCSQNQCTCRKHNIECSAMCKECRGITCFNCQRVIVETSEQEE